MLKNACFDDITDNCQLRSWKNRTYAEVASDTKNICDEPVKDVQKIGKSTLGKKDHNIVRNKKVALESIYDRLAEASSFSEDPPSPPNLFSDASAVQNSSSSVNISEGLDEDDNEFLNILNQFLNISDEASVTSNVHRNSLDTFMHRKKNVTTTDKRLPGHFYSETIFKLLTDAKIKVLEKGLDFASIQKKLNGFCRRMRLRQHFRSK